SQAAAATFMVTSISPWANPNTSSASPRAGTDPASRGSGTRRAKAAPANHAPRAAPARPITQGAATMPKTDPSAMHRSARPREPGDASRATVCPGTWATHEAVTKPLIRNHLETALREVDRSAEARIIEHVSHIGRIVADMGNILPESARQGIIGTDSERG